MLYDLGFIYPLPQRAAADLKRKDFYENSLF